MTGTIRHGEGHEVLLSLAESLEETAAALREANGPDGDADEAGRLVDRCAQLAAEAGAELDRRARAAQEGDAG